ncbi:MAG: serine protein kinase RIO [Candidatus Methanospirareceae archaeon]
MVRKEGLFEERIRRYYKGKRRERSEEDRKIEELVFDIPTLKTLYKLSKRGIIKALGGPISTGKEAVVFHAIGGEGGGKEGGEVELAVKIYKISTSNFNAMLDYIISDKRFENVKRDRKSIIFAWAHKEMRNLKRAFESGVSVPKPIACEKNVLVMQFIGEDGVAAPKLKDIPLEELDVDIEDLFFRILSYMKILYNKAKIVHADLSEFNILLDFSDDGVTPVIIDMGQSVLVDHPNAEEFLKKDVRNVVQFFNKFGLDFSEEEVLKEIKLGGGKDV